MKQFTILSAGLVLCLVLAWTAVPPAQAQNEHEEALRILKQALPLIAKKINAHNPLTVGSMNHVVSNHYTWDYKEAILLEAGHAPRKCHIVIVTPIVGDRKIQLKKADCKDVFV